MEGAFRAGVVPQNASNTGRIRPENQQLSPSTFVRHRSVRSSRAARPGKRSCIHLQTKAVVSKDFERSPARWPPCPARMVDGAFERLAGAHCRRIISSIPQLLAARHVPESRIAFMTAAALAPNFLCVPLGPILDVRFSRRWYATFFAAMEAIMVVVAILNLDHLAILTAAIVLGAGAAMLSSTALWGWLSSITAEDEKNQLSAWINIALICGIGVTSVLGGELVRHLPIGLAAALLGLIVFSPATIFLIMPAPGPDRRLAAESFIQFNREVLALLRRREVLIALMLFVFPCGSFALTNLLGGIGNDFHASARMVSLAGGVGAIIPGLIGCLFYPVIARRMPLRLLYLVNGIYRRTIYLRPHPASPQILGLRDGVVWHLPVPGHVLRHPVRNCL